MTPHGPTPRPVLVIIGPSGSGKSSVVRALADRELLRVHPTWTTRPRRRDEAGGSLEHRFVGDERFDQLDAKGFFLDSIAMFGLPYRYGLPAITPRDHGPIDTIMLRAPLVAPFAAFFPHHVVYQIEDTPDRMQQRLIERDCPAAELTARLRDNQSEIALGHQVAHRIFVNERSLAATATAVATALRSDFAQAIETGVA